jgi:hypothetical protein
VDQRIAETVRTGKVTAVAGPKVREQLSNPNYSKETVDEMIHEISLGIITDIAQVGGYPQYGGDPHIDTDSDGMPDEWETKHGLDPKNPADASTDRNGDGYTNIEDFINGLDPSATKKQWPTPRTYEDLWSTDPALKSTQCPSLDRLAQ